MSTTEPQGTAPGPTPMSLDDRLQALENWLDWQLRRAIGAHARYLSGSGEDVCQEMEDHLRLRAAQLREHLTALQEARAALRLFRRRVEGPSPGMTHS